MSFAILPYSLDLPVVRLKEIPAAHLPVFLTTRFFYADAMPAHLATWYRRIMDYSPLGFASPEVESAFLKEQTGLLATFNRTYSCMATMFGGKSSVSGIVLIVSG